MAGVSPLKMRRLFVAGAIAVAIAQPLSLLPAQELPIESAPLEPPFADKRSPARKQHGPQPRGASVQGQVYTYADGDRTGRVRLQADLEVRGDRSAARSSGEHIVTKDSSRRSTGLPVFRSESSGALMTLPGGVLLVLAAEWSETETRAFFVRHAIKQSRVSALDYVTNGFFVETAPGFPSLNLANTLAAQEGVLISSPNWWRDHTTR